jgi:hypothetical protein
MKFGSVRVLRDGRLRFSPWTFPGLNPLDFMTVYGSDERLADYSLHADWAGKPIFLLYVARHRIESACFAYNLTPDQLRHAVDVIRAAGNGLEWWVIPALQWCQRDFSRSKDPESKKLLAVIPELLESVRDLPVAAQWTRRLRLEERWEKEAAEALKSDRPSEKDPPRRKPRTRVGTAGGAAKQRSKRGPLKAEKQRTRRS